MRCRGYNLLELVVAISIMGTLIAFIAPVWPASKRTVLLSGDAAAAWQVASSELEATLAQGYDAMADRDGDATRSMVAAGIERSITYLYEVRITDLPPDMRRAHVTVVWNDGRDNHEVQVETTLTDPN
ncbi:MAG: type II secretion system protein [Vulcanimicrobiota bacterium]